MAISVYLSAWWHLPLNHKPFFRIVFRSSVFVTTILTLAFLPSGSAKTVSMVCHDSSHFGAQVVEILHRKDEGRQRSRCLSEGKNRWLERNESVSSLRG